MKKTARTQRERKEAIRSYFREISSIPLLTVEEERELAGLARVGNEEAITRLVESNLRFVIRVAMRYRRSNVAMDDLINEGNLGLMEAAKRFDPDRDVRFVSYAVWWIRNSILK